MKRTAVMAIWLVAVFAAIGLLVWMLPGCVGAPHNTNDLVEMSEREYDGWRERVDTLAEDGAYTLAHEHAGAEGPLRDLSAALRLLSGSAQPGAVAVLVKDDRAYRGLIRLAILELGALVDMSIADPAAATRIYDLVTSVANAIDAGVDRANTPPAP